MKKILLVLTGGTICSSKNTDGLNDLNTEAASLSLVSGYMEKHESSKDGCELSQNGISCWMLFRRWTLLSMRE